MRTGIFVLSLFFVVWCFVSARWYVCGIKQLCGGGPEAASKMVNDDTPTESKPIALANEPVQFGWSDDELIKTNDLSNWRDSIFALFDGSGSRKLVISGLYHTNEENTSQEENLGIARATAVAEWLMQEGFNFPIDLKSSLTQDENSTTGQNVGIAFEIVEEVLTSQQEQKVAAVQSNPIKEVEKSQEPRPKPLKTPATASRQNQFLFSSAILANDKELERQVQEIARRIKPVNGNLLVIGHSEKTEDELTDKKNGLMLATKVSELLIGQGIADSKVLTESAGSDLTRGGRHSNRVEIVVQ